MAKPSYAITPLGGPTTAASVAASPGPSSLLCWLYIDEYDAYYRWYAGDVTPADGYRVIGVTGGVAGRWILDGDRITLAPLGGGLDDWARLIAGACAAMAYKGEVHMLPGTWNCKTAQSTPNGTTLRGNAGVTIVSTLAPTAPLDFSNSVFYNSGNRDITTTTLSANAAAGANTIQVNSAAGIAVGTRFLIQHGNAYWTQREAIAVVGTTVTLDRPVMRPYSTNDVVSVATTTRDIRILGGGMLITGTGVAPVEFVTARDCYIADVFASVSMQFGFLYDVASRDCAFERCSINCNNATSSGYLLAFGDENISVIDCDSYRAGPGGAACGVYMASNDNCRVIRGFHSGSSAFGVLLTRDDLSDPIGCVGCVIDSTAFTKNAGAGVQFDIGSGNVARNVTSSYNQTGFAFGLNATRNLVSGGTAVGNTALAAGNSGTSNVIDGLAMATHPVGTIEGFAGELEVANCNILDDSTTAATAGIIAVNSANVVVRINGTKGVSTRNASHFVRCSQATAVVLIDGATSFTGSAANNFGVLVDAGVARISGFRCVSAAGVGVYLNGAAAYARIADDVDVSGCGTPLNIAAGAMNRGTIALNGAAGVAVGFGDTKSTDRLFWSYKTAGGTPSGVVIVGNPTAGVGFTISGVAGDTSTIYYEIR